MRHKNDKLKFHPQITNFFSYLFKYVVTVLCKLFQLLQLYPKLHFDLPSKSSRLEYVNTSDLKESKSRVLPHLLFYRNVCLGLSHTDNYTSYAQSFYWLPTARKPIIN
jgi:hypothetical protein